MCAHGRLSGLCLLLSLLMSLTHAWGQGQLINGNRTLTGTLNAATTTGSADAYVLTLNPAITAYVVNQCFTFRANFTNTGSATLNVNGVGARVLRKYVSTVASNLLAGDITSGQIILTCYDGATMQLVGAGGGSVGGDMATATSLATSLYIGDASLGQCTWAKDGTVFEAACDAAKTTLLTADIMMFDSGPMELRNADGDSCATTNHLTGLTTYHTTGNCQRPTVSRPFDALAFNVGTGVTVETVSLNGWPGVPVLDGPDSDTGTFALNLPVLWRDFAPASQMTLQLACHSIALQTGLTLMVRVGVPVCTGAGSALSAFVAPTSGTVLTCTFGAQNQDMQLSNVVTLTTTGCDPGERMDIPFVSEADMTAGWSTTTSFITGGILTYETVGMP